MTIELTPQQVQNLRVMLNTVTVHGPQEALILVEITMAIEKAMQQKPSEPEKGQSND